MRRGHQMTRGASVGAPEARRRGAAPLRSTTPGGEGDDLPAAREYLRSSSFARAPGPLLSERNWRGGHSSACGGSGGGGSTVPGGGTERGTPKCLIRQESCARFRSSGAAALRVMRAAAWVPVRVRLCLSGTLELWNQKGKSEGDQQLGGSARGSALATGRNRDCLRGGYASPVSIGPDQGLDRAGARRGFRAGGCLGRAAGELVQAGRADRAISGTYTGGAAGVGMAALEWLGQVPAMPRLSGMTQKLGGLSPQRLGGGLGDPAEAPPAPPSAARASHQGAAAAVFWPWAGSPLLRGFVPALTERGSWWLDNGSGDRASARSAGRVGETAARALAERVRDQDWSGSLRGDAPTMGGGHPHVN
ncbi:hypothetical protein SAMN05192580_1363 [Sphingomonas jatrophae]|uniref:Uncharacterized protein n=1 Tax=Sphingomonas jatrophae TaxID=1166337 RepID=A0A1I6K5X5_9SPHN|nr:hypothetical protein SAMN05192580_1363 [Sphingomonas jatrophae]